MVITKVPVSPPQPPVVAHEERIGATVSVDKPTVIACGIDGEPDLEQGMYKRCEVIHSCVSILTGAL